MPSKDLLLFKFILYHNSSRIKHILLNLFKKSFRQNNIKKAGREIDPYQQKIIKNKLEKKIENTTDEKKIAKMKKRNKEIRKTY